MYQIQPLNAFTDNYIWIIKNTETKQCAVIDPGAAEPVIQWLKQNNIYQLSDILITHHHKDHTGGIAELIQYSSAKVSAFKDANIPNVTVLLSDQQTINLLGLTVEIIAVPGHTLDHIVYYVPKQKTIKEPWLFSGDTLFSAGCGRVFEGTMEQMYQSLQKLNQLPAETKVFAAHEYTINNLLFALAIEPNNQTIKDHLTHCHYLRNNEIATLPSTLAIERKINPFLRCNQMSVITAIEKQINKKITESQQVFNIIREWKNSQS